MYQYQKQGYTQFKLTKKQHNKLFPKRKIKWLDRYEYYYNEHLIILHRFANTKGIIVITLLFPISVLLYGFSNIKDVLDELKHAYNQKKYGSFTSDSVPKGSELYQNIMDAIKK